MNQNRRDTSRPVSSGPKIQRERQAKAIRRSRPTRRLMSPAPGGPARKRIRRRAEEPRLLRPDDGTARPIQGPLEAEILRPNPEVTPVLRREDADAVTLPAGQLAALIDMRFPPPQKRRKRSRGKPRRRTPQQEDIAQEEKEEAMAEHTQAEVPAEAPGEDPGAAPPDEVLVAGESPSSPAVLDEELEVLAGEPEQATETDSEAAEAEPEVFVEAEEDAPLAAGFEAAEDEDIEPDAVVTTFEELEAELEEQDAATEPLAATPEAEAGEETPDEEEEEAPFLESIAADEGTPPIEPISVGAVQTPAPEVSAPEHPDRTPVESIWIEEGLEAEDLNEAEACIDPDLGLLKPELLAARPGDAAADPEPVDEAIEIETDEAGTLDHAEEEPSEDLEDPEDATADDEQVLDALLASDPEPSTEAGFDDEGDWPEIDDQPFIDDESAETETGLEEDPAEDDSPGDAQEESVAVLDPPGPDAPAASAFEQPGEEAAVALLEPETDTSEPEGADHGPLQVAARLEAKLDEMTQRLAPLMVEGGLESLMRAAAQPEARDHGPLLAELDQRLEDLRGGIAAWPGKAEGGGDPELKKSIQEIKSTVEIAQAKRDILAGSLSMLSDDMKELRMQMAVTNKAAMASAKTVQTVSEDLRNRPAATPGAEPAKAEPNPLRYGLQPSTVIMGVGVLLLSWSLMFYFKTGNTHLALLGLVVANLAGCAMILLSRNEDE